MQVIHPQCTKVYTERIIPYITSSTAPNPFRPNLRIHFSNHRPPTTPAEFVPAEQFLAIAIANGGLDVVVIQNESVDGVGEYTSNFWG